ncbi:MAG: apolipoprotein N-acyltransferase [Trueperaceae bacterium]
MLAPSFVRAAIAFLCGLIVSFAAPPDARPLLLLALPVAFGLIAISSGPRDAFGVGAAFAVGFFGLHVLWLPVAFSALLTPFFWVTFPLLLAALAAFWGGTAALARWVGGPGRGTLAVLAPLWVGVEMLRSVGFIGFPWGTLGYAWVGTPVAQWADLVGVHGLSLLTTASAAALAAPFVPAVRGARGGVRSTRPPLLAPLLAVAVLIAAWTGGAARFASLSAALPEPDRTALLVQGNVDPLGRAITPRQELDVHLDLTAEGALRAPAPPDLVVWPEGAVLGFPLEGFRGEPARSAIQASAPGTAFVVGGRGSADGGSTNAVFALEQAQIRGRYDKHVLVPFGERWPLLNVARPLYRAVFGLLGLPMLQNTVPGPGPAPLSLNGNAVGAYVCYESVFSRVPRGMVADGAELLINVTNDAWFGTGAGAVQHFAMGNLRAIETRRWLLRAGNDGITAAVDPTGTVTQRLPQGVADTLSVRYAHATGLTPYVRYGGFAPGFVAALVLICAGVTAVGRGRS